MWRKRQWQIRAMACEHPNTLDQFWLALHEVGGLTGIA